MKTWSAGEKVSAADLNSNFNQVAVGYSTVLSQPTTQTITCGFRINEVDIVAYGERSESQDSSSHGNYDGVQNKCAYITYNAVGIKTDKIYYIITSQGLNYGVISNITDTGFDLTITASGVFPPNVSLFIKAK